MLPPATVPGDLTDSRLSGKRRPGSPAVLVRARSLSLSVHSWDASGAGEGARSLSVHRCDAGGAGEGARGNRPAAEAFSQGGWGLAAALACPRLCACAFVRSCVCLCVCVCVCVYA